MFAGEAENRLDDLLAAAFENRLQPLYNFMSDLPSNGGITSAVPSRRYVRRTRVRLDALMQVAESL